jgi:hypothetical protein
MSVVVLVLLFSVRPVDPVAAETLEFAVRRSDVVRTLIATLERSNVIVHIQSSRDLPAGIGGITRFVVSRGGYRYLRVTIAAQLPEQLRAAMLAHELQHACEIAASPANDVGSLRLLFEKTGRSNGEFFETSRAVDVEHAVRRQLSALQAEPVVKFDH